jgi:16S rRNA A1518/A1519 N6-dimethyltransferase RsmA/KsgA/DIM1 with predicted DNA glycosylase/AP lyase activity
MLKKNELPFKPKKQLGQNFLFNGSYLGKITNSHPIDEDTVIVEIGSGYGHLTSFLSETKCSQLICFEKDFNL